jgi:hypothetical protein
MTAIYAFYVRSRKPTISLVMSVRLFVPVEQRGSLWVGFNEILNYEILLTSVQKVEFCLKSD